MGASKPTTCHGMFLAMEQATKSCSGQHWYDDSPWHGALLRSVVRWVSLGGGSLTELCQSKIRCAHCAALLQVGVANGTRVPNNKSVGDLCFYSFGRVQAAKSRDGDKSLDFEWCSFVTDHERAMRVSALQQERWWGCCACAGLGTWT